MIYDTCLVQHDKAVQFEKAVMVAVALYQEQHLTVEIQYGLGIHPISGGMVYTALLVASSPS